MTIGYPTDHKLMYLALKLMSPEARSQYLFQTDERIIANELMKIDSSSNDAERKNRAYRLASYLNHLNDPDDDTEETQIAEQCFKQLQYYYNCKFKRPLELNLDALLAFYDDYDFTFTKKNGETLTLISKVNRHDLSHYLGYFSNDIEKAIIETLLGDCADENGITITAKPPNLFWNLDDHSTCYWSQNGETQSKRVDQKTKREYINNGREIFSKKEHGKNR